jgi:hypothetical protein
MRRHAGFLIAFVLLLAAGGARAEEGRIYKVLEQFLDKRGRQSLAPSLYERDAYQIYLRRHPKQRSTLRLVVEWNAKGVNLSRLHLKADLRGLLTNSIQTMTVDEPIKKKGWFGHWANVDVTEDKLKKFGDLVAWRMTLWDGDHQLAEQKSFLWSGVPIRSP